MIQIWKEALDLLDEGEDFCIATIVSLQGSSPRHVGSKFLVKRDGATVGTIGGGLFESQVISAARKALEEKFSTLMRFAFSGDDTSAEIMICGGTVKVLIDYHNPFDNISREIYRNLLRIDSERLSGYLVTRIPSHVGALETNPLDRLFLDETGASFGNLSEQDRLISEFQSTRFAGQAQLLESDHAGYPAFMEYFYPRGMVYIFGAGHVGICVAQLATYVGFKVTLVDDREDFANFQKVPDAERILVVDDFENSMRTLGIGYDSYIVIVTRGHSHDKTVLKQALDTPARYVGMIGSRRKIKMIFDALLKEGVDEDLLKRVHSPIGLPIGGETPQEIAVSIVAELIQTKQASMDKNTKAACMSG